MHKHSFVKLSFAAALFSAAIPASAQAPATIDLNHTSAHFAAKHLLISTVQGYIPVREVKVTLGAGHVPTSVEASMDLTKIDTHNEKRDNDLRSERFLDVAKYPEMTFKSTRITPGAGGSFVMVGNLTIHGATNPVTLNGSVEGSIKDNQGRTHAGYAATTTIDRTQWGVGTAIPPGVVSREIAITIEAEAILQ